MNSLNHKPLTKLGFENSGIYCDPRTGECYGEVEDAADVKTAIDPVCQMEVAKENAAYQSDYAGERYYFCSADCQHEFDQNPSQYVGRAA